MNAQPYHTPSGRCSYKRMAAAAHTKLRIREHELAELRRQHEAIPKLIREVCRMLRGKEART